MKETDGENDRRILKRDGEPWLFQPISFRSVTSRNRIAVSPMCQYSAVDGVPDDWHFVHLGARAAGGAGIVFTEATHVEPRGRITPGCLGLWNDAQADGFRRIVAFIGAQGAVPAIQLAHAGRKASVSRPWEGTRPLMPDAGGWDVIGPSPLAYTVDHSVPTEIDHSEIAGVIDSFTAATRRARDIGFQLLELHCAHGYLAHEFLSPLSNRRTDDYGGDLAGRSRFLLQLIDGVRSEWPADLPLFIRLSCTDWVEGGWDLAQTVALAKILKARGDVDLIDCSSGGADRRQQVPVHPGYQVPLAEAVRRDAGIATGAVGLINSPDSAEEIIANGRADLVFLGRSMLHDPHWPLHAANALKAKSVPWPVQYERGNIF
ncbi:MAG: NADH:flavin oxidoreductase/NADH oxidase [Rhodospirillales bacterium]|nr:NADH:flavin oxidoreductase/NADH oxidase [Rhodospirillales bacterium]